MKRIELVFFSWLLWAAVCGVDVAAAQVNVESISSKAHEPGWGFAARADFGYSTGNVNYLSTKTSVSVQHLEVFAELPVEEGAAPWLRERWLLFGNYSLKSFSDERVDNGGFGHLRWTRMWTPRVGTEVFSQLAYDEFRLLTWRLLGGGGVRIDIIHEASVGLWMGSGYMVEWERRNVPVDGPDPVEMVNHRWTNYITLRWRLIKDVLTLANTVYIQPRWDDFSDIQVLDEASLETIITEHLSIAIGVYLRHDSDPPEGVESTDLNTQSSLIVRY